MTAGSDTSQFDGYQADERESDQIRPESSASQITSLSGHTVRRVDHRRHFEETSQIDEELEAADGGSTLRTHIEPSLDGSDLSREKSSPVGQSTFCSSGFLYCQSAVRTLRLI